MLEGVRRFNKGRPLQGPWGLAHGDGVNAGGDGAGGRSKAELTETQRETELS